jgi:hypothetical protein
LAALRESPGDPHEPLPFEQMNRRMILEVPAAAVARTAAGTKNLMNENY